MTTTAPRSRGTRVLLAFAATLLVLVPLGFIVSQFWLANGREIETVQAEQRGVRYLRPAVSLVGALTVAQSAAVRGAAVSQDAVTAAVRDVDRVDAELGADLGTTTRWTALRERITEVLGRPPSGSAAYQAYGEVVDLSVALMAKVGDTSQLILDPELDSYYLMDTALLRLPPVLVDAGRYTDLVTLADNAPRDLVAGYEAQAAVARDRVGRSAAAADDAIRKSIDATDNRDLGPALIARLDDFRATVTALAPLVQLADPAARPISPADLGRLREQVDRVGLEFDKAALVELANLLSLREQDIADRRTAVIVATGLGVLGAGWVLWSLLPMPRRDRWTDSADRPDDDEDDLPIESVRADESLVLLDARELLGSDQLIRVGRAVRRTRQEPEDDLS
ncbi:hypothetical protein [Actinokineospora sp.]|uniref:hypothetical protein n=1 Tax=Actinokineospora sp. TaxID=1872133 RepID=UPI004037C507